MDVYLLAIIEAAERGLECPPVRVLTGGLAVWGVPGASHEFLESSLDPLIEQYESFGRTRPRRERKHDYIDAEALAQEDMANVRWPDASDRVETEALTLLDAYVWPVAGGDALTLPALRLPVRNIQAWWIAGGGVVAQKKGTSTAWVVGGLFPIPLGN